MTRKINFSAGPAALPTAVLERVRDELFDWSGNGASVMEISHRSASFLAMAGTLEANLRRLVGIGDEFALLFLAGGARTQFAVVPATLAGGRPAAYLDTGYWSRAAIDEASRFTPVEIAGRAREKPLRVPGQADIRLPEHAAYLHYTPNETLTGLAFDYVPEPGPVPLVADMSSCILSGPIEIDRFGLIYACAQKNLGVAGLTLVIIRRDLLAAAGEPALPSVDLYGRQLERGSMLNTPATFAWYVAHLVVEWIADQGGLDNLARVNRQKAACVYHAMDQSGGFYASTVDPSCRSTMNACFTLPDARLERAFLDRADDAGMIGLKGHAAVGGIRASLYNALSLEDARSLAGFMREFLQTHG